MNKHLLILQTYNIPNQQLEDLVKYLGIVKPKLTCPICPHDIINRLINVKQNLIFTADKLNLDLYSNSELSELLSEGYSLHSAGNAEDFFKDITVGFFKYF